MAKALRRHEVELQDDYIKWCISNEAHDDRFIHSIEKFLKALREQGRRVPEDYSIICFDYSGDDWEQEGVTCSIHQGYQIGQEVASRLLKMIERRQCKGQDYSCIMPPQIYKGRSIKQIGKK